MADALSLVQLPPQRLDRKALNLDTPVIPATARHSGPRRLLRYWHAASQKFNGLLTRSNEPHASADPGGGEPRERGAKRA